MTATAAIETRPDADLRTFDGRALRVSVGVETLIETERGVRSGRLVRSRIIDDGTGVALTATERARLLASDYERLDTLTLSRARARLGGGGAAMVEVSFVSASSQRARAVLAQSAAPLRQLCGGALIWLLTDLPDNAPMAPLGEAVTFLKAHGRSVFAALNTPAALKSLRGAPIGGVAVSAPMLALSETEEALWLLNAARGLDSSGSATRIACGLANPAELAGLAGAAGFSHIAGTAS